MDVFHEFDSDDIKVLAHTECLILWDRLAETGSRRKIEAIRILHEKGMLALRTYRNICPFCEYFQRYRGTNNVCENCLWPKGGAVTHYCEWAKGSLYNVWFAAINDPAATRTERRKAARDVLNMLKAIEF